MGLVVVKDHLLWDSSEMRATSLLWDFFYGCWQEQPQQSEAPETSRKVIGGEMTGSAEGGRAVEVVYLGFGKAFDAVSHDIPLD